MTALSRPGDGPGVGDAHLEGAAGDDPAEVDLQRDQDLGHVGADAGDDHLRAHELGGFRGLDQGARDLGVDQGTRDEAGGMPADLDILAGGVEHLDDALVRHQLEQRLEVEALRQRIDHHRLVGAGDLRHAEFRIVGAFAQELGVDRHEGVALQASADFCQVVGRCDGSHAVGLI